MYNNKELCHIGSDKYADRKGMYFSNMPAQSCWAYAGFSMGGRYELRPYSITGNPIVIA